MKDTITITHRRLRRSRTYCRALCEVPPFRRAPRNRLLVGDAVTQLKRLPANSVNTVVTSPPYFMLRNYDAGPEEIGTEPDIEGYIQSLVDVCDQLARVLKPSGVMWLNINDSFSKSQRYGAPPKSLLLAPERLLLALADRAWLVRGKVVWAKSSHMPAAVRDRWTNAWEPLLMLTRSPQYFFDLDAARIPHTSSRQPARRPPKDKYAGIKPPWSGPLAGANDGLTRYRARGEVGHPLGKNPGDVWTFAPAGFRGAHFAVFPERLIERPILASCPERTCSACGSPWHRARRRDRLGDLQPSCSCNSGWQPGLVLDPFLGSGTVGVVAKRLHRDWLGIELNPKYAAMATERITNSSSNPTAVKHDHRRVGQPKRADCAEQRRTTETFEGASLAVEPAFDSSDTPNQDPEPNKQKEGQLSGEKEGDAEELPNDVVEVDRRLRFGEQNAEDGAEEGAGHEPGGPKQRVGALDGPHNSGGLRHKWRRFRSPQVIEHDRPSETAKEGHAPENCHQRHRRIHHPDSVHDPPGT